MEKIFATDDHSELIDAAGGSAFQFFESSDRMTKSASDVIGKADVQANMPPSTHFGVHLITMGAEEAFGPNRNGDSASIASLKKHHPSFEKFGCVFREHKNKCQATQGIGQVKLAKYNDKMHRGELIVWVDKDKAPDMYKQAKEGKELSWSMSMRLPHDECSCCHKKSARVTQYCDHLKSNMLQYVDGFKKFAYARNEDDVKFFDISEVKKRADRIATYLGYSFSPEDMAKAASVAHPVITGAAWAEHQLGHARIAHFTPWEELTLEKLASAVEFVKHSDAATKQVLVNMAPRNLTDAQIATASQPDFRAMSGEMAKRAMVMNFPSFASMITGSSLDDLGGNAGFQHALRVKLPSLVPDMMRAGGCGCGHEAAEAVTPDADYGCSFSPDKDSIDRLMREVGGELGMKPEETTNRAIKITIVKKASKCVKPTADTFYNALAEAYGYYVVKSAHIAKSVPGVSEHTLLRGIAASLLSNAN